MARWFSYAPGMTTVPSPSKDARPYHHGDLPRALLEAAAQAIAEAGAGPVSLRTWPAAPASPMPPPPTTSATRPAC